MLRAIRSSSLQELMRLTGIAVVIAAGLASLIATGGSSSGDTDSDGGSIRIDTRLLTGPIPQGQSGTVVVDVSGLESGEVLAAYAIDLPEEDADIAIETADCPSGTGTGFCEIWTITPGVASVPGRYEVAVDAVGETAPISGASFLFTVETASPVTTPPADALDAGGGRVIFRTTDGRLWGLGSNRDGAIRTGYVRVREDGVELGVEPQHMPVPVPIGDGSSTWPSVATSDAASFATMPGDGLWTWGRNGLDTEFITSPMRLPNLDSVFAVTAATRDFDIGSGAPMGDSESNWLTLDATGHFFASGAPVTHVNRPAMRAISIAGAVNPRGSGNGYVLLHDRTVAAIHPLDLDHIDSTPDSPVAMDILDLDQVQAIAAGDDHLLVLRADGTVSAAGNNLFGQLGDGTRNAANCVETETCAGSSCDDRQVQCPFVAVAGLDQVSAIAARGRRSFALRNGEVWIWGGDDPPRLTPVAVAGLTNVRTVAPGYAVRADCGAGGTLWKLNEGEDPPTATRVPEVGAQGGCSDVPPVAAFSFTPANPSTNDDVRFDGSASFDDQAVAIWEWDFEGDGVFDLNSSVATASFRYPATGLFQAALRVTDNEGLQATTAREIRIINPQTPHASFTFSPVPPISGQPVTFDGSASSDFDGTIAEFAWDFEDDGTFDVSGNRAAAGIVTHTFDQAGEVNVRLRVTDDDGFTDSRAFSLTLDAPVVTLSVQRNGQGGVTSVPAGIDCGADCSEVYPIDTVVQLDAVPASGWLFSGWGNDCSGSAASTAVVMDRNKSCMAIFIEAGGPSFTLNVAVSGQGSVTSVPAGISCGADCAESYAANTAVTLTAAPAAGSRFDRWTGHCTATTAITTVTLESDRSCTARFVTPAANGWTTVASDIAASLERDVRSAVALSAGGEAYIATLLAVGVQSRIGARREGNGAFPNLAPGILFPDDSAFDAGILLDAAGAAILSFNINGEDNVAMRFNSVALQWEFISSSLNLGNGAAQQLRMARAGDTLVFAWIETGQIAVRRYRLDTQQLEQGAFVPGPTAPFDLDIALDSNGLAVVAYTDGLLGSRLHAVRETAPGSWVALGGDIGVRPVIAPNVLELGIHVDSADEIRLVWLEGSGNYFVQVARFDGTNWIPLPGRPETRFVQSGPPVRTLSVNRDAALFAFAYAIDSGTADSVVSVWQLAGASLTVVGSTFSTTHPRVGDLSLAMSGADRATVTQSQRDAGGVFRLAVRKHVP